MTSNLPKLDGRPGAWKRMRNWIVRNYPHHADLIIQRMLNGAALDDALHATLRHDAPR